MFRAGLLGSRTRAACVHSVIHGANGDGARPKGPMSVWMVIGAIAIALVIAWLGLTALRAASGVGVDRETAEFRVTRIGELQIPRHCGEPMEVVRRSAGAGA